MSNMLERAQTFLTGKLGAYVSTTISITRGAFTTTDVPATFGRQILKVETSEGMRVARADRDFIIEAAAYVINGVQVEPAKGDIYTVTLEGASKRFQALPVGSEPAWRYADEFHQRVRVHAKGIGAA